MTHPTPATMDMLVERLEAQAAWHTEQARMHRIGGTHAHADDELVEAALLREAAAVIDAARRNDERD